MPEPLFATGHLAASRTQIQGAEGLWIVFSQRTPRGLVSIMFPEGEIGELIVGLKACQNGFSIAPGAGDEAGEGF